MADTAATGAIHPTSAIDHLLAAGLGDPETARLVGWEARVVAMVDVERALALALGSTGVVSEEDARAAVAACDVSRLDPAALAATAAGAATPVIPLVSALAAAAGGTGVSPALHLGATSQDIVDTAMALQLRPALDRIEHLLLRAGDRCAELAEAHAADIMAGRTLGQHAVPITFGLKAARWLAALDRRIVILRRLREDHLTVQLGGAAGTSGSYGAAGLRVANEIAALLGLTVPTLPRHAERDHIADLAGALAATAGVAGAIATDMALLAQTEVAEIGFGGDGGPTSSAMPHKRNPVDAVAARAAARLAVAEASTLIAAVADHELERAAGAWQAEWVAVPSLLVRTAGALLRAGDALHHLMFDPARARRNLFEGLGLTASESLGNALAERMGRPEAAQLSADLSAAAASTGRQLAEVALSDAAVISAIGEDRARAALDPAATLALVPELIARALAEHRDVRAAISLG